MKPFSLLALAIIGATNAASAAVSGPAELQTKVRTALRQAHSFVETVKVKPNVYAPLGGAMTFTVVAPNRFHQVVTGLPGGDDDTIIIGHEVYGRKGTGWTVQTWSDFLVNGFEEDIFNVKVLALAPDRTIDGTLAGAFVMKDPRGTKETDTLACTYDPATFRPLTCDSGLFEVKYAYDVAGAAVDAPANPKRVDK